MKPYDVRIVAEGEDQAIERFIEKVQIGAPPIKVEHREVRFEDFTGEFEYFVLKRGDSSEELGERLDFAGSSLVLFFSQSYPNPQSGEVPFGLGGSASVYGLHDWLECCAHAKFITTGALIEAGSLESPG